MPEAQAWRLKPPVCPSSVGRGLWASLSRLPEGRVGAVHLAAQTPHGCVPWSFRSRGSAPEGRPHSSGWEASLTPGAPPAAAAWPSVCAGACGRGPAYTRDRGHCPGRPGLRFWVCGGSSRPVVTLRDSVRAHQRCSPTVQRLVPAVVRRSSHPVKPSSRKRAVLWIPEYSWLRAATAATHPRTFSSAVAPRGSPPSPSPAAAKLLPVPEHAARLPGRAGQPRPVPSPGAVCGSARVATNTEITVCCLEPMTRKWNTKI